MRFFKRILRFFLVDLPSIILLSIFVIIVFVLVSIHKFFNWITEGELAPDSKTRGRGYSE